MLDFEPDTLLLHPTESEWILGYTVIDMAVSYKNSIKNGDWIKNLHIVFKCV